MKLARENTLFFISVILTIILTLTSILIKLSIETSFLMFSIGTIISFSITLSQRESIERIKEILSINRKELTVKTKYCQFIGEIKDPDLQNYLISLAKHFAQGDLVIGMLPTAYSDYNLLIATKKTLKATHCARTLQEFYSLRDNPRTREWLRLTREAKGRGVNIDQLLILNKKETMNNGSLDEKTKEIIIDLVKSGIKPRIIWLEDLLAIHGTVNLDQQIAIFDEGKVLVVQNNEMPIHILPSIKVAEYGNIFLKQKNNSFALEDVFPVIKTP